jgi:hypothetical protein
LFCGERGGLKKRRKIKKSDQPHFQLSISIIHTCAFVSPSQNPQLLKEVLGKENNPQLELIKELSIKLSRKFKTKLNSGRYFWLTNENESKTLIE